VIIIIIIITARSLRLILLHSSVMSQQRNTSSALLCIVLRPNIVYKILLGSSPGRNTSKTEVTIFEECLSIMGCICCETLMLVSCEVVFDA